MRSLRSARDDKTTLTQPLTCYRAINYKPLSYAMYLPLLVKCVCSNLCDCSPQGPSVKNLS